MRLCVRGHPVDELTDRSQDELMEKRGLRGPGSPNRRRSITPPSMFAEFYGKCRNRIIVRRDVMSTGIEWEADSRASASAMSDDGKAIDSGR